MTFKLKTCKIFVFINRVDKVDCPPQGAEKLKFRAIALLRANPTLSVSTIAFGGIAVVVI